MAGSVRIKRPRKESTVGGRPAGGRERRRRGGTLPRLRRCPPRFAPVVQNVLPLPNITTCTQSASRESSPRAMPRWDARALALLMLAISFDGELLGVVPRAADTGQGLEPAASLNPLAAALLLRRPGDGGRVQAEGSGARARRAVGALQAAAAPPSPPQCGRRHVHACFPLSANSCTPFSCRPWPSATPQTA